MNVPSHIASLQAQVRDFLDRSQMKPTTLGKLAANDGALVGRILRGAAIRYASAIRVQDFMASWDCPTLPRRRVCRLTPAQWRALVKARLHAGGIHMAGEFSRDGRRTRLWRERDFDRASVIRSLIGRQLLAPGDAFNSYVLTRAGLARLEDRQAWREARRAQTVAEAAPAPKVHTAAPDELALTA